MISNETQNLLSGITVNPSLAAALAAAPPAKNHGFTTAEAILALFKENHPRYMAILVSSADCEDTYLEAIYTACGTSLEAERGAS